MYIESGDATYLEQVELSLQKIRNNLNYLLDESREDVMMSTALFNMYYRPPLEVRTSLNKYLNAIDKMISVPPDQLNETDLTAERQYILNNVTPVLFKLDSVVHQYELESVDTIERLRTLELLLIASFLFCIVIMLFVFIIPWLKKNREKHALLLAAASSDHLTKLLNRKALSELKEMIFEESKHTNTPLSALMIDIDYFKQVNDQYGHSMGDKVLMAMSNIICKGIRETDYCFRYGGEEFLVVLPQTNLEQALLVAKKIHEHVKGATIENDDVSINVTLSIGVSTKDQGDDYLNEVIERADFAMYRAKNQGRDRIVHC